jgi:hypothetical protein
MENPLEMVRRGSPIVASNQSSSVIWSSSASSISRPARPR